MTEPLPCPFCCVVPRVTHTADSWRKLPWTKIECISAGCQVCPELGDYVLQDELIRRWNTRAPVETLKTEAWRHRVYKALASDVVGLTREQRAELVKHLLPSE
jgi:hypothetical protein